MHDRGSEPRGKARIGGDREQSSAEWKKIVKRHFRENIRRRHHSKQVQENKENATEAKSEKLLVDEEKMLAVISMTSNDEEPVLSYKQEKCKVIGKLNCRQ